MNPPDPPARPLNTEETLYALFARIRYFWLDEYGRSYTIIGNAFDLALRVNGHRPSDPNAPTFTLTIRLTGDGYQFRYRPGGDYAPAPEEVVVGYDEPAVLDRLFRVVMGYVEAERKRLLYYRSGLN
jgi:hypothetical protein